MKYIISLCVFISVLWMLSTHDAPQPIEGSNYKFKKLVVKREFVPTSSTDAKLMSREREIELLSLVPLTDDEWFNDIIYDPRIIVYTRDEIPNYYYHDGAYKDARYDIGPSNAPKAHNGSREFPWDEPGGTQRCDNVSTFKFMWLPKDTKIQYHKKRLIEAISLRPDTNVITTGEGNNIGYVWNYPVGTIFGEVHLMKDSQGKQYCYEIRVRIKENEDEWGVDIFRPFPNYKDLLKALPDDNPVARYLKNPPPIEKGRLVDSRHVQKHAINQEAGIDVLPNFGDEELVRNLLKKTVFKSALGSVWRDSCYAPTTSSNFSIVPKNYDGTFLGTDRESCMKCHASAGQDVSIFQFGRDWYGFIKGNQEEPILSFGIHDSRYLLKDAARGSVKLNPKLLSILEETK